MYATTKLAACTYLARDTPYAGLKIRLTCPRCGWRRDMVRERVQAYGHRLLQLAERLGPGQDFEPAMARDLWDHCHRWTWVEGDYGRGPTGDHRRFIERLRADPDFDPTIVDGLPMLYLVCGSAYLDRCKGGEHPQVRLAKLDQARWTF